jgi:polyferredoxin
VLGFSAALVQAYFKVVPPVAYGVCMVCHPRDLFNWLSDHLFHTGWDYSIASTNWPLLTAVGVVLGAWVAARRHREAQPRPARQRALYFLYGFLMINFGLVLGSCPIRIVLLTAYGNLMGLAGLVAVIAGVLLGTLALRWRARRAAARGVAL